MPNFHVDKELQHICTQIHQERKVDFLALAICDQAYKEIRWRYVVGSQSTKWKRMVIRFGKGLSGRVFQTGSPIIYSHSKEDALEYPIILAEKLVSAIAFPVFLHHSVWGVLLLGYRENHELTNIERELMQESVKRIEQHIHTVTVRGGA